MKQMYLRYSISRRDISHAEGVYHPQSGYHRAAGAYCRRRKTSVL